MGLYGTDYFIDNTMALEEAFNNELNNFNSLMEQVEIESITEGLVLAIINKFFDLWEKFYEWFIKTIKDLRISFKKSQINSLIAKAKQYVNKINPDSEVLGHVPAYKYIIIQDSEDINGIYTVTSDIYKDKMFNAIDRINNKSLDDLLNKHYTDEYINLDQLYDDIKNFRIGRDNTYNYSKGKNVEIHHWNLSDLDDRQDVFNNIIEFKDFFDVTVSVNDKLYKTINKYNTEAKKIKQQLIKSNNMYSEEGGREAFRFGQLEAIVDFLKKIANENFNLMNGAQKIIFKYCYGLLGKIKGMDTEG